MIAFPAEVKVRIAGGVTDMRCGRNSLALKVQEGLGRELHAGEIFCFRGRKAERYAREDEPLCAIGSSTMANESSLSTLADQEGAVTALLTPLKALTRPVQRVIMRTMSEQSCGSSGCHDAVRRFQGAEIHLP